jgi:transcription initiation factor TFIIB
MEAPEYQDDLNATLMCNDCKEVPPNLIEEFSSGDMVCASCGLVLGGRIIDTRSEWRTFSNDDQGGDDPSRVGDGPNLLLDGDQLGTGIAFTPGAKSKNARALTNTQNKISQDKGSKALLAAYRDISRLCDEIHAGPKVADGSKLIYKQVDDAKILKGKSQEAVIAGCIFLACRQFGEARTFREIFNLTSVPKKEIGRIFKQLENFLGGKNPGKVARPTDQVYDVIGSTTADKLCERFVNHLNFPNPMKIEKVAKALANKTSQVADLAGRSPLSVAAACIYMASHLMGEPRQSKQIANVAGVSDGTVKTAYRHLYAAKDSLIEKTWLRDGASAGKLPAS